MSAVSKIYVSYAWNNQDGSGPDRESIVDEIEEAIDNNGIECSRDKLVGSLHDENNQEFEREILEYKAWVLVISDKYLCSPNCMFEAISFVTSKQIKWTKLAVPVILDCQDEPFDCFDNKKVLKYFEYWAQMIADKEAEIADDPQNLRQSLRSDLAVYRHI